MNETQEIKAIFLARRTRFLGWSHTMQPAQTSDSAIDCRSLILTIVDYNPSKEKIFFDIQFGKTSNRGHSANILRTVSAKALKS